MYSCIYQMKKDKYISENPNSTSNNYELFDISYKEKQLKNNISL